MSDQRPQSPYSQASGDAALRQAGATPLQSADPAHIGPYVPLGRLGSGGMGRVYLARPADDGPGLAAVKVIRPEYAEDPEFRRRFEREAAVQGRVRTPHAPHLLGTGFEDAVLWMATQYLPGLNLADAVRECGPLEAAGAWRLVGELGQALSALSTAGVVHRDLKPSNVILTLQGAHVIDFGISQAVDSSAITSTGSRVGTPAFMSPEYLRDGRCDTASDVFSLAGTLIYAATGHAPFGDGTGVDVMHRVAFEEPKPEIMSQLSALDPALAGLLAACLAKDPAWRPTPQQLIETAAAAGHGRTPSWQEPLSSRLHTRQEGCEVLERATAQQTGHFRTPTERVAAPAPGPAFGPPTPPPGQYVHGQYGQYNQQAQHGQFSQHGSSTPPGQYGAPAPAPAPTPAPAPEVGEQGRSGGGGGGGRKRGKTYLAVAAGLAVCAVAVSAFLLTRTGDQEDTTSASVPTAVETDSTADDGAAAPLPGSSKSPSPSASKEKDAQENEEEEDEQENEADEEENDSDGSSGSGGSAGGTRPTPDGAATTTSAGGGSSSGGGGGGGGTNPTPAPTKTATKPATPPWISQCTYYSGTELTTYGDKNQRVVQVQCMLTNRGYSVGRAGVDGQFGDDTLSAVRLFQSDKGLEVDGKVGPNTWAALRHTT
ncbi:protein kinase domain-containing protein [Streptomyces sp. NPDC002845]